MVFDQAISKTKFKIFRNELVKSKNLNNKYKQTK